MRWDTDGRYRPPSMAREGFVHASFRDDALESARLYFPPETSLRVLAIDPRRLDVPVEVVETPRGPMPHIVGAIPLDAARAISLDDVPSHADRVTGTRFGFLAFDGMTLLDLVGPLDALSRIGSMGFDPTSTCEVVALTSSTDPAGAGGPVVWRGASTSLVAERYRPPLGEFDVLVVPGGPTPRAIVEDPATVEYVASYPHNRLIASVCTGALILGAAGRLRGKRATTHASALDMLAGFGAAPLRERVVDEGNLITSGGVTAGIDLGLHLVRKLEGDEVAEAIAARMEVR